MKKTFLVAIAVLFSSCGLVEMIDPTPDMVCDHMKSCASSFGNNYDRAKCISDVRTIEDKCGKSARDVKACLISTNCTNDPTKMLGSIFACYGKCSGTP